MKKGFTLIELLAVIVILAIIALIATPIILNIIEDASEEANQRSVEMYAKAIENATYLYELNNNKNIIGSFKPEENSKGKVLTNGIDILIVEYNGQTIECQTIEIYEDANIYIDNCKVNNELIEYTYGKKQGYDNGEIVYFDVSKGKGCTEQQYKSSWDETLQDYLNSKTGYNGIKEETDTTNANSCLKFYAINDNEERTIELLLDHNTTALVQWGKSGVVLPTNKNGPVDLLQQLKVDTSSWKGVITPENYTTGPTSRRYTIDYSDSNARLITANEVAQVTGNYEWDETVKTTGYSFYGVSNAMNEACKSGDIDKCQYGWIYDRTSTKCKQNGCFNNADSSMTGTGYWTASSNCTSGAYAWYIKSNANLGYIGISYSSEYGVRPVIKVLKNDLK